MDLPPSSTNRAELIACPQCDLLHGLPALPARASATCARCKALLVKNVPDSLDRTLAWFLAAANLFVIANSLPLVALEAQGTTISTTLLGTVRALDETGMPAVATLVFTTTILMPALEIIAMLYLLIPLRAGRVPRYVGPVFRALHAVKPWVMVEVFMLGMLVSLAKLAHIAAVVPELALWSFAALMLALASGSASFHGLALWSRVAMLRAAVAA